MSPGARPPGGLIRWLLTASTAVRALGELGSAAAGVRSGSLLAALGGFGQVAATVAFVVDMWVRVGTAPAAGSPR